MGIGKNIKSILEQKNMTVVDLANLTEIPSTTLYSMMKRDNKSEKYETLQKIIEALDVEMEDLIGKRASTFHSHLFSARQETGLTREEFSEASQISLKRFTRLENGVEEPTEDDRKKIAVALGVLDKLPSWLDPSSEHKTDNEFTVLYDLFYKLNSAGKLKALENVELLTKVKEYLK